MRSSFCVPVAALTLLSCGGTQSNHGASGAATSVPLEVSLDSASADSMIHEDKVSAGDAATPDGRPDARFTAHVRGEVRALILNLCEDAQNPSGTQWDTIIGQQPMPEGYPMRFGYETWVLGVFDANGRRLNRADGSLPTQTFSQTTTLQLYAAQRDNLVGGHTLCLTALPPSGPAVTATADLR